jgi:hypothetical protein
MGYRNECSLNFDDLLKGSLIRSSRNVPVLRVLRETFLACVLRRRDTLREGYEGFTSHFRCAMPLRWRVQVLEANL